MSHRIGGGDQMIWWLLVLGVFLLIAAFMYVPDWIRWARWNAKRKRLPENRGKKMRAPVAPPFWSTYAGAAYVSDGGPETAPSGIDGTAGIPGDGADGCD